MQEFIVDIGSFLSGRTIRVQAHSAREALGEAKKQLSPNKFEQVIQIRDDNRLWYYTHEHGLYDWR
jgi:hypothetical protein